MEHSAENPKGLRNILEVALKLDLNHLSIRAYK